MKVNVLQAVIQVHGISLVVKSWALKSERIVQVRVLSFTESLTLNKSEIYLSLQLMSKMHIIPT